MMELKKIKKALKDIVRDLKLKNAETDAEINGKWVHLLIVAEEFAGLPQRNRENMVWRELERKFDDETLISITQCYLLAPEEQPASLRKVS